MGNTLQQANPYLYAQPIQDVYVRQNFQKMIDYFATQNQLLNFKFFEIKFTAANTAYTLAHGLGAVPKDVIVTKLVGSGVVTFFHGKFDSTNAYLSISGACTIRFYLGTYWNSNTTSLASASTDQQSFSSSSVGSTTGSTATGNITPVTMTASSSLLTYTILTTNSELTVDCTSAAFTFVLPSAASCTGQVFYIEKTDASFNAATIAVSYLTPSDYIDTNGTSSTTLNTLRERVEIISMGTYWLVRYRDYYRGTTAYTPTLNTSGGGAITLNVTSKQDPSAYWWREGPRIFIKNNFTNGSGGGATGTAGTMRIGLPTGVLLDITNDISTTGWGYILGGTMLAYSSAAGNITTSAVIGSGSDTYFTVMSPASGSFYAVAGIVAGLNMAGTINFPVTGWKG